MKTLRKVKVKAVYVKYIPDELEQNSIYISKEFGTAVHLCLCGCGEKSVMPLNPKFSSSWNLIEKNGKVSFTPSILNTNCPNRCHYIITNSIANIV